VRSGPSVSAQQGAGVAAGLSLLVAWPLRLNSTTELSALPLGQIKGVFGVRTGSMSRRMSLLALWSVLVSSDSERTRHEAQVA